MGYYKTDTNYGEHKEKTIIIITVGNTFKTSSKMGLVVCFFTAVFSLLLFSGSTHSLTYLRTDVQGGDVYAPKGSKCAAPGVQLTSDTASSWGLHS